MKLRMVLLAAALIATSAGATDRPQFFGVEKHVLEQVREGRETFRYSTFGDEAFWGDGLGLHLAIAGAANGGVGAGLSPADALAAGLKVDRAALPRSLQRDIARGKVNLKDPAVTLELLKLDAWSASPASSTNAAASPRWEFNARSVIRPSTTP